MSPALCCRANVGAANKSGCTALMRASLDGHVGCLETLVVARADIGATDHTGRTALMLAVRNGHVACVDALLMHGADVAAASVDGRTALMLAALHGQVACLGTLVRHRADPGATDHKGLTALACASREGHMPCVQALLDLERGPEGPPAHSPSSCISLAALRAVPSCSSPTANGKKTLKWAAPTGGADVPSSAASSDSDRPPSPAAFSPRLKSRQVSDLSSACFSAPDSGPSSASATPPLSPAQVLVHPPFASSPFPGQGASQFFSWLSPLSP